MSDTLRTKVDKALTLLERESVAITHQVNRRIVNVGEAETRQINGRFMGQATYDEIVKLLSK